MSFSYLARNRILDKSRLYRISAVMVITCLFVSGAVIFHYGGMGFAPSSESTLDSVAPFLENLMPFLIAASIAALTAIAVMNMLPTVIVGESVDKMSRALKEVRSGDLTIRVRLKGDDQLLEAAECFNEALGIVSTRVDNWKMINRQQWGVLCRIRHAVEMGDKDAALEQVAVMEQNWDKIVDIENSLIT